MLRKIGNKEFDFSKKTYTMGIVNITPDSFSDGGKYDKIEEAHKRIFNIIENGADIIDIGAESSRPGSNPVDEVEEWNRLEPILSKIARKAPVPISIDTYKSSIAEKALAMGIEIINDISGLKKDAKMAEIIARYSAYIVIMHMRGNPKDMQEKPYYENVVEEVIQELKESIKIAKDAGIEDEKIILDPGIGFGKRHEDNLILLNNLDKIVSLGYPVLVGASRKRFIGDILESTVEDRLEGSLAVASYSAIKGANIMRVHDVAETVKTFKIIDAISNIG